MGAGAQRSESEIDKPYLKRRSIETFRHIDFKNQREIHHERKKVHEATLGSLERAAKRCAKPQTEKIRIEIKE